MPISKIRRREKQIKIKEQQKPLPPTRKQVQLHNISYSSQG